MAAPAFGTIGTKLNFTGTTQAVPVPASVASGDIIVVFMHLNSTTATITARPTGFAAAEGSPIANGTVGQIFVEWKRATGADTGTYDFTISASQNSYAWAARYTSCVLTGNPWDTPTATANPGGNTSTSPAVSINTAGPDRLLCHASSNDNGASGTWTPPSGFTERAGGVNNSKLEFSDKVQAVAGGSGTVQCTTTATFATMNAWLGALIGTTPNPNPVSAVDPADTFLPDATLLADEESGIEPLGFLYQPTPEQFLDAIVSAPPFPSAVTSTQRVMWVRGKARHAIPPIAQTGPIDLDQVRTRARPTLARLLRSRSAQPVPVQATPVAPTLVPAILPRRVRVALRTSSAAQPIPPQFNPPIVLQPLPHRIRALFRRQRPSMLAPDQAVAPVIDLAARRRPSSYQPGSRTAEAVPPQFNPPLVPLTLGHRVRTALRRGHAAQPVPTVAAPVAPTFIPDVVAHRLRVMFRRPRAGQRPTVVPQSTEQPPTLITGPRLHVRPRKGVTAAPIPAQVNPPWTPSALVRWIRPTLRRGTGRTASPVPAQQAAPVNPAWVPSLIRKIRPALRRGSGRTASPTPAQQAAPTNPAFVPVTIRKVRALLTRRSRTARPAWVQETAPPNPGVQRRRIGLLRRSKTATPTPVQQTAIPNPPFVFVDIRKVRALLIRRSKTATTVRPQHFPEVPNRAGVIPGLLARRGKTAQPPIVQTQPPTSPAVRNRQRRRVLVWQRRGRNAWRELGQAVAPVVQFFQGVITGGTRAGPGSTGGTRSGPGATGKTLHGTVDFFGDLYGDGYPGGEGTTDLGVTGGTRPGPGNTGKQQDGTNLTGGSR